MLLFLTFLVRLVYKPLEAMFHYFIFMFSFEPQLNHLFSSSWLQVNGHSSTLYTFPLKSFFWMCTYGSITTTLNSLSKLLGAVLFLHICHYLHFLPFFEYIKRNGSQEYTNSLEKLNLCSSVHVYSFWKVLEARTNAILVTSAFCFLQLLGLVISYR